MQIKTIFLSLLLTCPLAACGGGTTYDSFRPVKGSKTDIAYVNTTADFSKYGRLMVDEMGIFFPTSAPLSEQDIARIRIAFRTAFIAELKGYEIVEEAGPDVMKVTASLVDLRHTKMGYLPGVSNDINDILQPGKLTFTIEMKDSKSDRVLIRAADTEKAPVLDLPEDGTAAVAELDAAAEYWAQLFRSFLDKNLKGS
jgi:hypothetical protein